MNTADVNLIVKSIVLHQQSIIGPLAIDQANKVPGIVFTSQSDIKISANDPKVMLANLVNKYQDLFGAISVEVCKEAIKELPHSIPDSELPEILQN